jgi:hypothetical protein
VTQSKTVQVATCHDPGEATLIRTVLSAHGIAAIIPEGASSAGVMAVGFRTHVFVDADDAEEATALIAEMRAAPSADEPDEADDEPDERAPAGQPELNVAIDRRKRVGALVLVAVGLQFGTAHLFSGAWKRGLALAALEIYGIRTLWHGHRWGAAVVVAAVLMDLVGSIVRAYQRASPSSRLPVARLKA